jgi:hypothetical protein
VSIGTQQLAVRREIAAAESTLPMMRDALNDLSDRGKEEDVRMPKALEDGGD